MFLDFLCYTLNKTGHNIGVWLESCHRGIGCKPDYIGSHAVDGAGNAGASVMFLELNTSDERSQKIKADRCDAHKCNTTANLTYGTSDHVVNLNPNLGSDLTYLHSWLSKIENSGECTKVLTTVQTEHGRKKTTQIECAVTTRWNSRHSLYVQTSINLILTSLFNIWCVLGVGGVNEQLYIDCNQKNDLHQHILMKISGQSIDSMRLHLNH
jgi:hypothetical protein